MKSHSKLDEESSVDKDRIMLTLEHGYGNLHESLKVLDERCRVLEDSYLEVSYNALLNTVEMEVIDILTGGV